MAAAKETVSNLKKLRYKTNKSSYEGRIEKGERNRALVNRENWKLQDQFEFRMDSQGKFF